MDVLSEAMHHVHTMYDSKAILSKSMLVGASLGMLPWIARLTSVGGMLIKQQLVGLNENERYLVFHLWCTDYAVNSIYANALGLTQFTNLETASMTMEQSLFWAKDLRWYDREGKLPIFQYNVEGEVSE